MAGVGTVAEKQVLRVEELVNSKMVGKKYSASRSRVIQTGLKCDIVLAGNLSCLEKIESRKCPFTFCGLVANQRCSTVHKKVMEL